MPVERVFDEDGCAMTLIRYSDNKFAASDFVEDSLVNMKDAEVREDDVLLCSYSKSGCHWMWEVLRMLQHGSTSLQVIKKEDYMMEFSSLDHLASLPSPRILNNHMPWEFQPRDIVEKKVKVVFIYRNPKDVAVSFYHHHIKFDDYDYHGTFENHLKRLVQGTVDNGSPFQYLREWEEAIYSHPELPIFVGCYEDMKENPLSEIRRLSNFLGHKYSEKFLREVQDLTTFDSMKQRKGPISFHDTEGQPIMYRKGQVGDWKNYFTTEQSDWFDEVMRQEMPGSRLKFRFTLDEEKNEEQKDVNNTPRSVFLRLSGQS